MINYNIGIIVFLNIISAIYPFLTSISIRPLHILIIILLVVAFDIIAFFLLVRGGRIRKNADTKFPQNPQLPSTEPKTLLDRVNDLNEVLEPFGFVYSLENDIFYSAMYGWQRDYGYCQLYDEMTAPLCMIIDCEPIRFEYGGKKWMIEFWKGQYGMTTGCEVGVYTTTGPSLEIPGYFYGTFYKSASKEDFLPIAVTLRKKGNPLFSRKDLHWWLTGFVLGEFSHPSELIMDIQITFKDQRMRDAFVEELFNVGYKPKDISVQDTMVSLTYDKPYSNQPATRIPLTESLMQKYNQQNCEAYQSITKGLTNSLDKLDYLQKEYPRMYLQLLNLGKPRQLFDDFEILKPFLGSSNVDDNEYYK
ncbi:MAG: hypothetical protein K0R92_2133 [Lachnospiraceae bacterium]|jgi:hypothetical protein|nr:hypothetical protein [Lachnospiraceae bacterium]